MPGSCLIDLYVPTEDAHDASVAVAMAGLDAGVLVFTTPEALASYEPTGPTPMHGALGLEIAGGTVVVVLPSTTEADHQSFTELDALEPIVSAAREAGGTAFIAGGHMSGDQITQEAVHEGGGIAGRIVHMVWRSILARDLSFEDASLCGRRLLGGTGPMGDLNTVGRYATLLPIDAADRSALIGALNAGLGFGVERGDAPGTKGDAPPKKRRRRRRRRRGRSKEEGEGGSETSSSSAPAENTSS